MLWLSGRGPDHRRTMAVVRVFNTLTALNVDYMNYLSLSVGRCRGIVLAAIAARMGRFAAAVSAAYAAIGASRPAVAAAAAIDARRAAAVAAALRHLRGADGDTVAPVFIWNIIKSFLY